jgi:hypothetical protein
VTSGAQVIRRHTRFRTAEAVPKAVNLSRILEPTPLDGTTEDILMSAKGALIAAAAAGLFMSMNPVRCRKAAEDIHAAACV